MPVTAGASTGRYLSFPDVYHYELHTVNAMSFSCSNDTKLISESWGESGGNEATKPERGILSLMFVAKYRKKLGLCL
jgi:hypothetical protein